MEDAMRSLSLSLLLLATAGAGASEPQQAATLADRALDFELACCTAPEGWNLASADQLDTMRGGFTDGAGLAISLGIERLVTINGDLVSRTSFQIANMNNITADEARQAHEALNSVRLVQNGANNFAGADVAGGRGTFIQNSLSNQAIGTQTIINSSVNSMSLLKDMNFQDGLRDAAIRAIGTH
jgi:hypothetical protein